MDLANFKGTLQETNISHHISIHIPPLEKENHLPNPFRDLLSPGILTYISCMDTAYIREPQPTPKKFAGYYTVQETLGGIFSPKTLRPLSHGFGHGPCRGSSGISGTSRKLRGDTDADREGADVMSSLGVLISPNSTRWAPKLNHLKLTPPKFNSSPLKNDGWKMILSYWVSAYFQG